MNNMMLKVTFCYILLYCSYQLLSSSWDVLWSCWDEPIEATTSASASLGRSADRAKAPWNPGGVKWNLWAELRRSSGTGMWWRLNFGGDVNAGQNIDEKSENQMTSKHLTYIIHHQFRITDQIPVPGALPVHLPPFQCFGRHGAQQEPLAAALQQAGHAGLSIASQRRKAWIVAG